MTSLALKTLIKQLEIRFPDSMYNSIVTPPHWYDDGFDEWWIEEAIDSWHTVQPILKRSSERRILG